MKPAVYSFRYLILYPQGSMWAPLRDSQVKGRESEFFGGHGALERIRGWRKWNVAKCNASIKAASTVLVYRTAASTRSVIRGERKTIGKEERKK